LIVQITTTIKLTEFPSEFQERVGFTDSGGRWSAEGTLVAERVDKWDLKINPSWKLRVRRLDMKEVSGDHWHGVTFPIMSMGEKEQTRVAE
jgi:hypothetical protein